jgi:hypothetical protein
VSQTSGKLHTSFFRRILRTFTGRCALLIYSLALFLLLLALGAGRLHSYIMGRKIEAVLHGLRDIRLDQTTEEQLIKTVPYLAQRDWAHRGVLRRSFDVQISNESDLLGVMVKRPSG